MKLVVKETDHNIRLGLPTGLLLNRVTAFAIARTARKYGVSLTCRQTLGLVKATAVPIKIGCWWRHRAQMGNMYW